MFAAESIVLFGALTMATVHCSKKRLRSTQRILALKVIQALKSVNTRPRSYSISRRLSVEEYRETLRLRFTRNRKQPRLPGKLNGRQSEGLILVRLHGM